LSFFEELKRRNVVRVALAYGVASWVILQVADLVLDNVEAPGWVMHVFMLVVALGFLASVVIAWAYEITPEGIKKESDVERSQSISGKTGKKLDRKPCQNSSRLRQQKLKMSKHPILQPNPPSRCCHSSI
jgi:Tfp pilus assembly protein PilO